MLTVFGSINLDAVFPVHRLAAAGDTVWTDTGRFAPGGKGLIQAAAAAADGARVSLYGAVGRDPLAEVALAAASRVGVDIRGVARVAAITGRAAIAVTPDGHTAVVADRGANALARADQVPGRAVGRGTTLLLQLDTAPAECASLILRARAAGARVILNVSPSQPIDADALRAADLLIGNSEEIAWLGERLGTGNNAASIHAALATPTVRMLGVQGAEATTQNGWFHMPAFAVEMRDTTAAGDCFVGVLASALDRRLPFPQALQRAGVAAALSTRRVGGGETLPTARDIDAALPYAPQPTQQQQEVPA